MHYIAAVFYLWKKDLDRSAAEADVALNLNPNYAQAHNSRGIVNIYGGQPLAAVPHIEQAIRLDPAIKHGTKQDALSEQGCRGLVVAGDQVGRAEKMDVKVVNLAVLDRRIAPEGAPDRRRQRLRSVDDEQARHGRIEPPVDEIGDQRSRRRRVFRRALDKAERMLFPRRVDADRRHQQRVVGHVDAVDLDDHEVEMVEPGRHPLPHARRRQRDEAARGRRFRQTGAPRGRHVAPGQAHRPLEFARGDGDQHLVHRPFAEPILPDRALPTRQHALLSVEAANARTLDIDLTAVKADLALRPPPSMRLPAFAPRMARAANRLGVLLHHFAQRLDPRRKAKSLEARRHAGKRPALQSMRWNRRGCDSLLHGVAFLLVESAPRAYRLKASNAAPPFSTSAGASPHRNYPR